MFGYVKPFKPMLRVCEFDTYQAVYCGLCKQLSRSYGPFIRLTLSYDFTFLVLLELAVGEETPCFSSENCLYNPLKKKPCCHNSAALQFGAAAAVLMLYYKVLDNIHDEHGWKRFIYRMALPFVRSVRRKALINNAELDEFIGAQMKVQAQLEQNNCDSVDQAGEPVALCLARLFIQVGREEGQRRVLERLGYLLGRWIYLADALDDLEEDRKKARYNPFLLQSQRGAPVEALKKEAVLSLNLTIGEIVKTFQLLEVKRYHDLLENIVDLGLRSVVGQLAQGKTITKKIHRAGAQ